MFLEKKTISSHSDVNINNNLECNCWRDLDPNNRFWSKRYVEDKWNTQFSYSDQQYSKNHMFDCRQ